MKSALVDPRFLMRRLATAFLAMPRHLPARPEPRHVFDNVARASNPLPPKGAELVSLYQSLMRAAIWTKNPEIIERKQAEIIAYHDEILTQGLADSPLLGKVAFEDIACTAMHETAEAMSAIGAAGTLRSEGAIDQAVREAGEAVIVLEEFREIATARQARRQLQVTR